MSDTDERVRRSEKIFYTLRPHVPGRGVFSDVKMPDGSVIRRVDQSVHELALKNAAKRYREKYGE